MPYSDEGDPKYHQPAKRPVSLKGFIKIVALGLALGALISCLLYIAAVI